MTTRRGFTPLERLIAVNCGSAIVIMVMAGSRLAPQWFTVAQWIAMSNNLLVAGLQAKMGEVDRRDAIDQRRGCTGGQRLHVAVHPVELSDITVSVSHHLRPGYFATRLTVSWFDGMGGEPADLRFAAMGITPCDAQLQRGGRFMNCKLFPAFRCSIILIIAPGLSGVLARAGVAFLFWIQPGYEGLLQVQVLVSTIQVCEFNLGKETAVIHSDCAPRALAVSPIALASNRIIGIHITDTLTYTDQWRRACDPPAVNPIHFNAWGAQMTSRCGRYFPVNNYPLDAPSAVMGSFAVVPGVGRDRKRSRSGGRAGTLRQEQLRKRLMILARPHRSSSCQRH